MVWWERTGAASAPAPNPAQSDDPHVRLRQAARNRDADAVIAAANACSWLAAHEALSVMLTVIGTGDRRRAELTARRYVHHLVDYSQMPPRRARLATLALLHLGTTTGEDREIIAIAAERLLRASAEAGETLQVYRAWLQTGVAVADPDGWYAGGVIDQLEQWDRQANQRTPPKRG